MHRTVLPLKRYINASLLLVIILLPPSCSQDSNSQKATVPASAEKTAVLNKTGDSEKGKVIYEKYCFYCHGREGRGDGAIGIAVTPHPADFVGDKRKMAKSDDELMKSISEGIRREVGSEEMAMPRWKDILSEEDMWNALAYIRELSRGKK